MVIIVERFNKLYFFYNVQVIYEHGKELIIKNINDEKILYHNSIEDINTLEIDGYKVISHNRRTIYDIS